MKVVVFGSGVVGVTTAWFLAQAGCEVVVVDRQPGPGLETSFANAGEISPGYAAPWAGPGVPLKAIGWLLQAHAPLAVRPFAAGPAVVPWLLALLANCNHASYRRNKSEMVAIAEYSRDRLRELRAATGIAYDERALGTLQVFRTEKQLAGAGEDARVLDAFGVAYEILDAAGCRAVEPGLAASAAPLAGGMRLSGDETGDCHLFTRRLADLAAAAGVTFRPSTVVRALETEGGRVVAAATDQGRITGDAFVVALASHSPRLVRPLGVRLPVYPVKGYSLTAPILDERVAPVSTVLDETYKVAVTRLGERVRVGGTAELSGYSQDLRPGPIATLRACVSELFPGACDAATATAWTGLRAMTPTGVPAVGPTRIPNLHLNTGHGTLGWTMACGAGRLLADLMTGKPTDIDPAPYDPRRFG